MVALRSIFSAVFHGALQTRLTGIAAILALALLSPLSLTDARAACSPALANNQVGGSVNCTGTDLNGVGNGSQDQIGVAVQPGATIDITSLGGGNAAIYLNDSNVVTNSGTILIGDNDAGIFATNGNTVSNFGLISGGFDSYGISVNNGNSVFNYGTITMLDGGVGINVCCSNVSVINSGKITVGDAGYGIAGSDGNTIINAGSIVVGASLGFGSPASGIDVFDNNTVINSGTITAGDGATGINLGNDNPLVLNSGTIQVGQGGYGIGLQQLFGPPGGYNNTIVNSGTIIGADSATGIVATSGNTITNSGSILLGDSGIGIRVDDDNTISNSGTIRVGANGTGVELGAFGGGVTNTFTNTGSVIAGNGGYGLFFNGDNSVVTNYGLIKATNGYSLYSCNCTFNNAVTNYGTLDGAIEMLDPGGGHTLNNYGLVTITDPASVMSIGQFFNIGGTFNQFAGGVFAPRVDETGVSDQLLADNANLAGTLKAVIQPGLYGLTTTYNGVVFIYAGGMLSGTFETVTTSSPFFAASATYVTGGANDQVDLTITRTAFNAVPGMTDNQRAVGNALEPLYDPNTLTGDAATFFSNLLAATSLGALDALSGEGLAQAQSTAFKSNQLFGSTLLAQINAWLAGNPAGSGALAYAQADAKQIPAAFKALEREQRIDGWRVWMAGFFGQSWANGELPAGSADARSRTGGGAFGVDRQIAPDMLAGIAVGASESKFNVPDRQTEGDILGGHIAAYGIKTWGEFYTSGSVGYARFDNNTNRTISGVGTTEYATGKFASDLVGGRAELGYRTRAGQYNVTPFIAIEPSQLWQRGFTEASVSSAGGAGILGLNVASRSVSSLPLFAGAQVDTRMMLPDGTMLVPHVRASWVHEFMPDRQISASFITLPDAAFTVQGARAARNSGKIGAGARWFFNPAVYAFANFDGEFSDRTAGYSASAGFKSNW